MKKLLPVDMDTFSDMIKGGYLYGDKTEQIARLFSSGQRYFFISRPRRFGKSLLITTLKSIFSGEKELFADLWLGKQKEFNWQQHPVVHLDFSLAESQTPEKLEQSLNFMLDRHAEQYGVDISKAYSPKTRLILLIEKLAAINSVVFLVDEYDKPILDHLHNPKQANAQREVLKTFYDGFKGLGKHMRCIFITGVSKFSKTSIFSGLNNLDELSYMPAGADLIGYTEEELVKYFAPYIEEYAQLHNETSKDVLEKVRHWYNGYQFSSLPIKVYNPFSIVHFCSKKRFHNYWFESGTPSFLVEVLKKKPLELSGIEKDVFSLSTLGTFQVEDVPMATLFFQSGYLTIGEYDPQYDIFRLKQPNEEVKQSLAILELGVLIGKDAETATNLRYHMQVALENKDIEAFAQSLRTQFASIPYSLHIQREAYYHSIILNLCNLLSFKYHCEEATSKGRIDLTLTTQKYIYIFELKLDDSPQNALQQIYDKKYYEKYQHSDKELVLVGMAFSFADKALKVEWLEGAIPS